jgi:hypothetical protein
MVRSAGGGGGPRIITLGVLRRVARCGQRSFSSAAVTTTTTAAVHTPFAATAATTTARPVRTIGLPRTIRQVMEEGAAAAAAVDGGGGGEAAAADGGGDGAADSAHTVLGSALTVRGWIKSLRKQKRVAFASIADGSTPGGLQVVVGDPALVDGLEVGAAAAITGTLAPSPKAGQPVELHANTITLLGAGVRRARFLNRFCSSPCYRHLRCC